MLYDVITQKPTTQILLLVLKVLVTHRKEHKQHKHNVFFINIPSYMGMKCLTLTEGIRASQYFPVYNVSQRHLPQLQ